jgi:hypothetical protein
MPGVNQQYQSLTILGLPEASSDVRHYVPHDARHPLSMVMRVTGSGATPGHPRIEGRYARRFFFLSGPFSRNYEMKIPEITK